jgi:hypothetical protein
MDNYNNQKYIFDKDCGEPDNYSEIFQLQNKRRDQFGEYNYIKQKNGAECRYYRPNYDYRSWVKKDENGNIVLFYLHQPTEGYIWYIMRKGENKFFKHRDQDDKPAQVDENYKKWFQNGKLHRLTGYAIEDRKNNKNIYAIEDNQYYNETDFKRSLLEYYKNKYELYNQVFNALDMMPMELTDLIVEFQDNIFSKKKLKEKIQDLEEEMKKRKIIEITEEPETKRRRILNQSINPPSLFGNQVQLIRNTNQNMDQISSSRRRFRP